VSTGNADSNEPLDRTLLADLQVQATHRLMEALVESESQMRRRVQMLSDVVIEIDADGRCLFLNDAWHRAVGEWPADCIGRRLEEFLHPDDRSILAAALESADRPSSTRAVVVRVLHSEHQTRWMEMSVAPMPVGRAVVVLHDISEQKRAQDELARLSLVASRTDNLVVITDGVGHIEWVNEAFTTKTGYLPHEVHGRKPGEVLQGPDTDPATVAWIGERLRDGCSFEAELLNYTKFGEPYWVRLHITPIRGEHGEVEQYVAVQADSTELHRTQGELEIAKQRAEQANEAKTMFLATISHEMRTPLNAVLGSTELALDDVDDPQVMLEHLQRIKRSSEALLRLITDILDVSKIEAGQIDIEPTQVQLRPCLDEVFTDVRARAAAKGLFFTSSWDQAIPALVECDPGRLQQIVRNLAENAVRFTDSGFVRVEVTCHESSVPGQPVMQIAVLDSGIGISEETQHRIFDRFEQGDSSLTRRKGGAGLGLSIVRSLVEVLGGTVSVTSTPGQGSAFRVCIPLTAARTSAVAEVADAPLPTSPCGTARVLIAEDDEVNFIVLQAFLQRAGYDVTRVHNGEEAVLAASDHDLILMDVEMPKMDGLEATRRIRQAESERGDPNVPIIMVTAHALEEFRDQCYRAGASGFLTKPMRKHALLEAVAGALSSQLQGSR
jgi:PAS domain S-box-containing protein